MTKVMHLMKEHNKKVGVRFERLQALPRTSFDLKPKESLRQQAVESQEQVPSLRAVFEDTESLGLLVTGGNVVIGGVVVGFVGKTVGGLNTS
ncbi:hypothetical protein Bca52824_017349 [Brassica carinata]|uniref:Uncharacterized protein n=1 Tax=Brassica carinata TaxID=52824 RepID=A0A8X8AX86_BRACI|nr:hypothetical protein Bca52824_017349 [Brassica carinata]